VCDRWPLYNFLLPSFYFCISCWPGQRGRRRIWEPSAGMPAQPLASARPVVSIDGDDIKVSKFRRIVTNSPGKTLSSSQSPAAGILV
jgi:hypothetical protein